MRTLKISLLVFILSISIAAQWFQQNSGTTNDLKDVCFVDDNNGWIVGTNGIILRTTNGGNTWFQQISGTIQNLYSVDFVDVNYGWAVGANNTILHTIIGGANWTAQTIPADTIYNSVFFLNQNLGWAAGRGIGSGGYICKTTNGGVDWIGLGNIGPYRCISVFFVNQDTGWIIRQDTEYILKSEDGGFIWWELIVGVPHPYDGYFLNENIGWVVGSNSTISKTTNGGFMWWIGTVSSTNYGLYSIHFVNENKGWVAGTDGFIGFTNDSGYSWSNQSTGINETIRSIYFIDENTGWAVGDSGKILFTENGGITSVEDNVFSPFNFYLSQNYPNPFNPSTSLQYAIGSRQFVTLMVYDLLGREVATLVNEEKPAGEYEVEFNASSHSGNVRNLTSGIYFYQLKAGEYSETRKMVLLK